MGRIANSGVNWQGTQSDVGTGWDSPASQQSEQQSEQQWTQQQEAANTTNLGFNVTDANGNNTYYSADSDIGRQLADQWNQNNRPDKFDWNDGSKDKLTISLNKDTGDIDVNGPDYVLKRDHFNDAINMDQLKQLSANYKENKDVTYQVPVTVSEDGENKEKTETMNTEQFLNHMNGQLQDYVTAAKQIDDESKRMEQQYGTHFSDDDVMTVLTGTATGASANDDTEQVIPDFANINFFKERMDNNPIYQKAMELRGSNKSITRKQLMDELYSREKFSDDEITRFQDDLKDYLRTSRIKEVGEDGKLIPTQENVSDIADVMALNNYMYDEKTNPNGVKPTTGFWRGVLDVATNTALGGAHKIGEFLGGALALGEDIIGVGAKVVNPASYMEGGEGNWETNGLIGKAYHAIENTADEHYQLTNRLTSAGAATWNIVSTVAEAASWVAGSGVSGAIKTAVTGEKIANLASKGERLASTAAELEERAAVKGAEAAEAGAKATEFAVTGEGKVTGANRLLNKLEEPERIQLVKNAQKLGGTEGTVTLENLSKAAKTMAETTEEGSAMGKVAANLESKAQKLAEASTEAATAEARAARASVTADNAVKGFRGILNSLPEKESNQLVAGALKRANASGYRTVSLDDMIASANELAAKASNSRELATAARYMVDAGTEIVSDTIMTAAFTDPTFLSDYMSGKATDEEKREFMTNFTLTLVGFGGAKAIGGVAKEIGKTRGYQALNLLLSSKVAGLESKLGAWKNSLDVIKKKMANLKVAAEGEGKAAQKAGNKLKVREQNAQITEAKGKFAETVRNVDLNTEEGFAQASQAKSHVLRLQNATDRMQRGVQATIARFYGNKNYAVKLTQVDGEMLDLAGKIRKMEKSYGMKGERKGALFRGQVRDGAQATGVGFSTATANYMGAQTKLPIARRALNNAIKRGDKEAEKSIRAEMKNMREMKVSFEQEMPAELVESANSYVKLTQEWYHEFENVNASLGLRSEEEMQRMRQGGYSDADLAAKKQEFMDGGMSASDAQKEVNKLRDNGMFGKEGKLYARTQREQEWQESLANLEKGEYKRASVADESSYQWGAEGNFVDPELVRYQRMVEFAKVYDRNNYARILVDGATDAKVVATSEQTTATKAINKTKKNAQTQIEQARKEAIDDLIKNKVINKTLGTSKQMQVIKGAQKQYDAVRARFDAAIKNEMVPSLSAQKRYINGASDDVIRQAFQDEYGVNGIKDIITDEASFNAAIENKTIPTSTQRLITNKIKEYYGIVNPDEIKRGRKILTYERYQEVMNQSDENPLFRGMLNDFDKDVDRSIVAHTKSMYDSEGIRAEVAQSLEDARNAKMKTRLNQAEENLNEAKTKAGADTGAKTEDVLKDLDDKISDSITDVLDDAADSLLNRGKASRTYFEQMCELAGVADVDTGMTFLAYHSLQNGKKGIVKDMCEEFRKTMKGITNDAKAIDRWTGRFGKRLSEEIDSRFNSLRAQLGSKSPLVDTDKWYKEVYKQMGEIENAVDDTATHINILDSNGKLVTYETDPMIAHLANYKEAAQDLSAWQKVNYVWSKFFRLGTTGIRLTSIANQTFRDSINAWVGGGLFRTMKTCAKDMEDIFGKNPMKYLSQYTEFEQAAIRNAAEESGQSIEKAMTAYEIAGGKAISPAATEVQAYRINKDRLVKNTSDKILNTIDNVTEDIQVLNNAREGYLRNVVYANAIDDALAKGHSLEYARTAAEFLQSNATTNFSRTMTHLASFQQTVPYLGAAVNGTKSFYRLWEMDPLGVTARLMGGIALPTIALTAASLSSEENVNIWRQLPEYMKKDCLPFIVNGQVFTIPLPQELGSVVAPFRQFVESLYNADRHSFWELAANDIIGISPIDLTGFLNIDNTNMLDSNNMMTGLTRVASQLAPPPIKSAFMAATGIDPYTNRKIYRGRVYADSDTNQPIQMDSTTSAFAKWFSESFGGGEDGWCSAELAALVIPGIVGKAGLDVLDTMTKLGQYATTNGKEGSLTYGAERMIENVTDAITSTPKKNQSEYAWYSTISSLYQVKSDIQNTQTADGQYYNSMLTNIRKETDLNKKNALIEQKNNWLNEKLYRPAKEMVEKLISTYGAESYDRKKFAATISLLNMYSPQDANNTEQASTAQDSWQQAYNQAVATMTDLGFPNAQGGVSSGIFGYLKRNTDTGKVSVVYNNPLSIMNTKNILYSQSGLHMANIKALLENQNIKSKDMWNGYYQQTTSAAKKAYKQQWNAKIIKALAPYIQKYGASAVINSKNMAEFMDDFMFVDNPYKAKESLIKMFK